MNIPESLFGSISTRQFLEEYWQQKPLFVKGAWPDFTSPVSPDDLKDVACRDDVEARLILEEGGDYPWELRFGPFEPEELDGLGGSHWALLVQHMDRLNPDVGRMLEAVSFLPNWRLDDIMISFAPGEGGVGPHIDNYDVFLIQGLGRRRWQVGLSPVIDESIVEDLDVRILANFTPDEEFEVEPGDLLYLPPRYAHHGIALGDCMTYSIGCRAPSVQGLVSGFLEHLMDTAGEEHFFSDPRRAPADQPGRIDSGIVSFARRALQGALANPDAFRIWLGEHLTEGPEFEDDGSGAVSAEQLLHLLGTGAQCRPRSATRLAFDRQDDGGIILFVQGRSLGVPGELLDFVSRLCRPTGIKAADLPPSGSTLQKAAIEVLVDLLNEGHLFMVR